MTSQLASPFFNSLILILTSLIETNRDGSGGGGGGGGGGAPPTGGNSTLTTRDSNSSTSSSDSSDAYSVQIGDKAFHETYLAPFYDTVKNGMGGAMCAMNRVNGTYSCESQDLLAKYLKVELGFPGLVNADVSAQKTGINAANAGMDLSSSSYFSNETLGAGLNNGSFTEARLNDMVARNLMGYYKMGQDKGFPEHVSSTAHVDVRGNHAALARKYAGESIALLKNTANALPLKELKSVSIFGYHATQRYVGANTALSVYQGEPSTMQGHMTTVGGSAMGSLAYLVSPVQRFVDRAVKEGFMLRWWLNDTVSTSSSGGMMGSGTELSETTTGVAENSDACVVFLNSWGGEGGDRSELYNADQDHLVSTVADNCNNTIVVVNTVGPRLVDAWIAHDNVTGVLYAGPLGQESASAIDDVLFGAVNPSGRLVHTIARNESDYNQDTVITEDLELDFADGNYIDYKYFDKYNVTPRYEFGYGLSYTTFEYASTVSVRANNNIKSGHATSPRAVGGREDLWDDVATVHTTVRNTGRMAGAEVAQLYVSFPDAADEPVRQLRGYQKVTIQPGKEADVSFTLRRRDLSVWDVARQEWEVVKGDYKVYIGASSRDLKSSTVLSIV